MMREPNHQFPTWGCIFFICMGIGCLYYGLSVDSSNVDCGGRTMSPDQECITTSFNGSSSRSTTLSYTEQREQNGRVRVALIIGGIIFLFAGAGPLIARARRTSSGHTHSQNETRRDNQRSFMDVTLGEALDNLWGRAVKTAPSSVNARSNDGIEAEFRSVFFNRTSADRERIISHWMRAKSVGRADAMRLAIDDWRRDNRRAG